MGVLGAEPQKNQSHIDLIAQDRDALAVTFTAQNAVLNQLHDVCGRWTGINGLADQKFDLIVSNLPGKAGHAVLQIILHRMPAYLTDTGLAAMVVVKPLADLVAETLAEMESEILLREEASGYEVFHFRDGDLTPTVLSKAEVGAETQRLIWLRSIRNVQTFKLGNQTVDMQYGLRNLPEF